MDTMGINLKAKTPGDGMIKLILHTMMVLSTYFSFQAVEVLVILGAVLTQDVDGG